MSESDLDLPADVDVDDIDLPLDPVDSDSESVKQPHVMAGIVMRCSCKRQCLASLTLTEVESLLALRLNVKADRKHKASLFVDKRQGCLSCTVLIQRA